MPYVQSADAQSAPTEFNYWSMWSQGEPQQRVLQAAIDQFTSDTGVKVNAQWVGRDNLRRLAPALNTPNIPADLVDGAQRNVKAVLVSTNSHNDMAGVYAMDIPGEAGKKVRDVIPERYLNSVTQDGVRWLVPYEIITSMWWYDADYLPELAASPPRTWDDLMGFLARRKAAGHAPLALDGDIGNFNLYYFTEIAVRHLGPGRLREAAADRTGEKLKDPRILQTARQIEALVRNGYFADGYSSGRWPAMQQRWATNKADLIFNGPWLVSEVSSYSRTGFKPRAFQMPAVGGASTSTMEISFIGFGVPKNARRGAAAERFIAYFMNKERLSGIASIAKNLTPRADIAVPPELNDAKLAIDATPAVHTQFDGLIDDHADYVNKVLTPLNNELVFGRISAPEFQERLVKQSIDYWRLN